MASDLLAAAGFSGDNLAIALGVAYWEAAGPECTARFGVRSAFQDAVGDVELAELGPYNSDAAAIADWNARKAAGKPVPNPYVKTYVDYGDPTTATGVYLESPKWGPSIGWFQIRALDDPTAWGVADRVRIAEKLRDPAFSASAAWIISRHGTDWTPWSAFKNGQYEQFKGLDFELKTGHSRAHEWSK